MQIRFVKPSIITLLFACLFTVSFAEPSIKTSATGMPVSEETIKAGETLFKAKCSACHALDRRVTGPALKGVTERREVDWLIKWINNNADLRQSGDADAVAIFNEYNGVSMNLFPDLTEEQIKSILMYTENGPLGEVKTEGGPAPAPVDEGLLNKTNWLLLLLSLIVFIVVVIIVKTLDLVGKLTGREVIPWNNVNATLMLFFLIIGMSAGLYELSIHGKYTLLSNASSEHGASIDRMMKITFIFTGIVFFVTQIALFYFAFRYRQKKGVKALYYPENDKLELLWTIIPAIVLTVLVLGGLNAWRGINKAPEAGTAQIEVFAHQFAWKVRYPGADGKLGNANYNLISETSNPLGVAIDFKAEEILKELETDLVKFQQAIDNLPRDLGRLKGTLGGLVGKEKAAHIKQIAFIESGDAEAELRLQIRRRHTQIKRIKTALEAKAIFTKDALDDIVGEEIHIVVNKPITFKFRSRDVIHSALMKEFRAQMNVVPGIPTQFTFKPIKTTAQRRAELNDPNFDYHIICNKICGASHFNMKIKIVVEDQDSYDKWMRDQKPTFLVQEEAPAPAETESTGGSDEITEITPTIVTK